MLNKVALFALILFSLYSFACKQNSKTTEIDAETNVNNNNVESTIETSDKKAPDFSLTSVDGKQVKLSDFKNKIVIIDFWATWCPPCRKGIPDLIEIQKEYKDDVVIIGVSVDRETKKDVPAFVKNYGINYPVVYATADVITAYGGIQAIPTAFIVDKKGNIVDTHVGLVPKSTYVDKIKKLK